MYLVSLDDNIRISPPMLKTLEDKLNRFRVSSSFKYLSMSPRSSIVSSCPKLLEAQVKKLDISHKVRCGTMRIIIMIHKDNVH